MAAPTTAARVKKLLPTRSRPHMAHRDRRRFDGQPSLSGHCGHGPIFGARRSVANDPEPHFWTFVAVWEFLLLAQASLVVRYEGIEAAVYTARALGYQTLVLWNHSLGNIHVQYYAAN